MTEILAATIGGIALILVAVIPIVVTTRTSTAMRESMAWLMRLGEDLQRHLPDNGHRLYEMVESTHVTTNRLVDQVSKLESRLATMEGKVDVLTRRKMT